MDELIAQAVSIARGMWRRRWIGMAAAWLVAAVGAVFLWKLPERYEANARVYVDTKSVLKPLMRDLAVEPDIDQTVGMLARTLITRPNVEMLMRKVSFETPGMTQSERDTIVDRLQRDIEVASSGRDNVFTFSYRDADSVRARVVVESLVSLFGESDLGAKMRDTEQAREFINVQIKAHEVRLAEAEARLKDFKLKNLGMTETGGKDYFSRITAVTEELSKVQLELRAAEQSRDALRHEVAGETATLLPDSTPHAITGRRGVSRNRVASGRPASATRRTVATLYRPSPRRRRDAAADRTPGRAAAAGTSMRNERAVAARPAPVGRSENNGVPAGQARAGHGRGKRGGTAGAGRRCAVPAQSTARLREPRPAGSKPNSPSSIATTKSFGATTKHSSAAGSRRRCRRKWTRPASRAFV